MPNVQSIPGSKNNHVSQAEHDERDAFRNGEGNLYSPGILDVPDAYDPNAGSKYPKTSRPEVSYGPLLATDEGQPDGVGEAKIIGRQPAIDRPDGRVVRSRGSK
jgi:hypothetical protein